MNISYCSLTGLDYNEFVINKISDLPMILMFQRPLNDKVHYQHW